VFGANATGFQQVKHARTKLGITIRNCLAIGRATGKSFSQLLHHPAAGRMLDGKEAIQGSEREGWHGEEIDCCDGLAMIAKESSPEFVNLVGRRLALDVSRDGTFGNFKLEF